MFRSRPFLDFVRLTLVVLSVAAASAKDLSSKDDTDRRIHLMGDALSARDRGDLLAAQKAIAELSVLSPKDPTVQRLRAEIEAQLNSMKAATAKISAENAPPTEKKPDSEGAIEVKFSDTPTAAELAKLAARRVSFFSTRAFVGNEGKEVVVKFTVDGEKPRLILIRGLGPTLKTALKKGFLPEPQIELIGAGDAVIKTNSDWKSSVDPSFIEAAVSAAGGSSFDREKKDAAIVTTLTPGSYSIRLSGLREKTGIGLVEIYQFNP
jgi:hypothetical protein